MKARLVTYPERDLWNNFISASQSCPILQSFEWGELKARFGWQPLRLVIENEGKIVAAASILKKKIPYIGSSIFYAPRGPVVNFSDRELLEFMLSAIEEQSDNHRAISFKMDPEVPDMPQSQSGILDTLTKIGFVKAAKQVQPRATFWLDLSRDLDDILKSFEEKTRYNVRLAEKKGVLVKEEPGKKGIEHFYQLYQQTSVRDKFMIHPKRYYESIRELLFEKGLGTNFIAYYENKPIASVIIFAFGNRIWYMYGASSSEHRNKMPNHLLHWEVISWAKQKGYKLYDLWGIPVKPVEGHPLWGVYRFKKGFAGREIKFIGAYDFPYSPLFYNLFEKGAALWKNLNSLLKKGKIEDSLSE